MNTEEFYMLCHSTDLYKRVEQKNSDITGGYITRDEIDLIEAWEGVERVMISGLKQDTFDYFVQHHAHKFKAILFWKNKLVEDWSSLSTLKDVEFIGYFHNQRITKMWDMTGNHALKGLSISDFTRLHSLDGIQKAPALERLHFGDAVWPASVLDDLKPLEGSRLKEFTFSGKKIKDEDISVFTTMPNLEVMNSPTNHYTTEQLAWLVAKLPHVEGYTLKPYIQLENRDEKDVLICGKRKPFLSSGKDAAKIQKYADKFEELVRQYKEE